MDQRLYDAVDFILNHAKTRDIEVIQEALKKRLTDQASHAMGYDPENIAREISDSIEEQVHQSIQSVEGSVREYVASLIKEKVPEIPDEHLKALLDSWVPKPGRKKRAAGKPGAGLTGAGELPEDVVLAMVGQFLSYSTDTMPPSQQAALREEIPDWQEKYWQMFPDPVKKALRGYLKGELDSETCWRRIHAALSP
jgi:hypothetical protein